MTCRGSATTTHNQNAEVHIAVAPAYISSEVAGDNNWFSYRITIRNCGDCPVRLLSRYWRIIDGDNQVREITGDGVVGRQPIIDSGEEYQYTSYVDFPTPVGYMEGSYTMETEDGRRFEAIIDMFSLSLPGSIN